MNQVIRVSVIVPIYNAEQYLEQCIESVLSQSYQDLELILVNDGSTDKSPEMCNIYKQSDGRVKVIHKENGGLSSARNAGIKAAVGEYIIFLDSDDYYDDLDALSEIIVLADKMSVDVIIWGYKKKYDKTGKVDSPSRFPTIKHETDKSTVLFSLIKATCYNASAWDKAVKRDLILKNNLFFEPGVFSEDVEWSARLAVCANNFALYENAFYIYRQRAGSITKCITEKNIADTKKHFISCYELAKTVESGVLRDALMGYAAVQFANLLIVIAIGQSKNASGHIRNIKKYSTVLDSAITKRAAIINTIRNIVGLRFTVWLLRVAASCLNLLRRV